MHNIHTSAKFKRMASATLAAAMLTLSACAQPLNIGSLISAANRGDAKSAFTLAQMYETGDGICQSYELAYGYYAKAMMQRQPYPGSMEGGRRAARLMSNPNATYQLPHNVAAMTQQIMEEARAWRADAQLMRLVVNPRGDTRIGYDIESARSHEGEWVMLSCSSDSLVTRSAGRVNWGNWPLPIKFMDIDEALAAAGRAGLKGRIDRAEYTIVEGRDTHRAVWKVVPEGLGNEFLIDPSSGKRLRRSDIDDPDPLYEQFTKAMRNRQDSTKVQQPAASAQMIRRPLVCPVRDGIVWHCFFPFLHTLDDPSRWHQKVPAQ